MTLHIPSQSVSLSCVLQNFFQLCICATFASSLYLFFFSRYSRTTCGRRRGATFGILRLNLTISFFRRSSSAVIHGKCTLLFRFIFGTAIAHALSMHSVNSLTTFSSCPFVSICLIISSLICLSVIAFFKVSLNFSQFAFLCCTFLLFPFLLLV